jgi:hypothetical protein
MVVTNGRWGFSTTSGGGMFRARAHRGDCGCANYERRELDLSHMLDSLTYEQRERLARRWGLSNGFLKHWRRPASSRRFRRRLERIRQG